MYIKEITIKNFRKFDSEGITIRLNNGINGIIGANNLGKSAIIDAIRIAFSIFEYKKDIYFSVYDFHIYKNHRAEKATFDFVFGDVPLNYMEIIDDKDNRVGSIHFSFMLDDSKKNKIRIKTRVWGGNIETNVLPSEFLQENFNLYYLNALRNVEQDMKPSRNSKINKLVSSFYSDEERKEALVNKVVDLNKSIEVEKEIKLASNTINRNLFNLEKVRNNQFIKLGLVNPEFESIISSLKPYLVEKTKVIKYSDTYENLLKENGLSECYSKKDDDLIIDLGKVSTCIDENADIPQELSTIIEPNLDYSLELFQNGLGYNNIIYMATVLGDISKADKNDLNIFLIEEPEAHLHPQLQRLVHKFFKEHIEKNKNTQIIYTSHSPTMVSKIGLKNLNILSNNYSIRIEDTKLYNGDLKEENDISYLENFFDVTKSQLLFSKGVVFVEGATEEMLIPMFANMMGKSFTDYDIEIINIDGVNFEPFAKLLIRNNDRRLFKFSIITDDDRCSEKTKKDEFIDKEKNYDEVDVNEIMDKLKIGSISSRCEKLLSNYSHEVFLAKKTLEYELTLANPKLILDIIKKIHPTSYVKIQKVIFGELTDDEIATKINYNKERIAAVIWLYIRKNTSIKTELAYEIISMIGSGTEFNVPEYIKNAIEKVIGD